MNLSSLALPRELVTEFGMWRDAHSPVAPACGALADLTRSTSQGSVAERNLALAIAIVSGIAGAVMAIPF